MDLGSIFLIFALALLVAWYVGRPLLEGGEQPTHVDTSPEEHERSSLLAERDRMLKTLRELDFDFALGKIPEEDYPQQREFLMKRAAEVLRRLDALQESDDTEEDVGQRIEAAIAARRAEKSRSAGKEPPVRRTPQMEAADDDLEALLAKRRRERQGKAAGFCPKCGVPVQKTDRFCPKCGASLV